MNIVSAVDHTLLKQTATWADIQKICDEGMEYGTASVCIPPSFVKRASEYINGRLPVCTVIGFPNGYSTVETKAFEAKNAAQNGADEIDMVIDLGLVKDRRFSDVQHEIEMVKTACGTTLKVIIETCLLTEKEKIEMCKVVSASGADFIKTSTGFSTGGATDSDIILFREHVESHVRIKAAGGISTLEDARRFLELGAHRLGTSRIIGLLREKKHELSDTAY